MYVCATGCLQRRIHRLYAVINPRQVPGYENLCDRCVLLIIIRFVTFNFQPNSAATSSPSCSKNKHLDCFSKNMDPISSKDSGFCELFCRVTSRSLLCNYSRPRLASQSVWGSLHLINKSPRGKYEKLMALQVNHLIISGVQY